MLKKFLSLFKDKKKEQLRLRLIADENMDRDSRVWKEITREVIEELIQERKTNLPEYTIGEQVYLNWFGGNSWYGNAQYNFNVIFNINLFSIITASIANIRITTSRFAYVLYEKGEYQYFYCNGMGNKREETKTALMNWIRSRDIQKLITYEYKLNCRYDLKSCTWLTSNYIVKFDDKKYLKNLYIERYKNYFTNKARRIQKGADERIKSLEVVAKRKKVCQN